MIKPIPRYLQPLLKQMEQKQGGRGIYIPPPFRDHRELLWGQVEKRDEETGKPIFNQNRTTKIVISGWFFGSFYRDFWNYLKSQGYKPLTTRNQKWENGIQITPKQLSQLTRQEKPPFLGFPAIAETHYRMNKFKHSGNEELREIAEIEARGYGEWFREFKPKPKPSLESEMGAEIYRLG